MTTLTWLDDVPDDVRRVRHPRCGRTTTLADVDPSSIDDGAGKLFCWPCAEAGEHGDGYGFVAARRPRVADMLPEPLASAWAPSPHALWDHGHELGLTASDRVLIDALWRHQSGGRAFPSRETLALKTGLGTATVSRRVAELERRGLLSVWRHERIGGRRGANEYDLTPLWDALAQIVATGDETPAPPDQSGTGDLQRITTIPSQRITTIPQEEPGASRASLREGPTRPTTRSAPDDHDPFRGTSVTAENDHPDGGHPQRSPADTPPCDRRPDEHPEAPCHASPSPTSSAAPPPPPVAGAAAAGASMAATPARSTTKCSRASGAGCTSPGPAPSSPTSTPTEPTGPRSAADGPDANPDRPRYLPCGGADAGGAP